MSIPKIIWQTYKDPYTSLPQYIKDATRTWIDLNPEYEYKYMSDEQAEKFIYEYYGKEMHSIFINMPLGVMRGDLWRYLVIYEFGGVYTDLDTLCKKPVSSWIKDEYNMIVCPENDKHYCQWTFAASPKNEILKSVVDLVFKRNIMPDYTQPHFVHYYTGPKAWTDGIMSALKIKEFNYHDNNLIQRSVNENNLSISKEKKFLCYGGDDYKIFHNDAVYHLYGSQNWKDEGYVKWIDLVKYK